MAKFPYIIGKWAQGYIMHQQRILLLTPPINLTLPVVSGTAKVGEVLTTTDGTWDSPTPITYSYQWQRDGVDIAGATANTYTIVSADYETNIRCEVTATNSAGSTIALSNQLYVFAFVTTWLTTTPSETITLPLVSTGTYSFDVDWGDGSTDTITAWNQAETTHTYTTAGTYTVKITGTITGFRFGNAGDRLKIQTIDSYGSLNISTDAAFYGCTNLTSTATDAPVISTNSLNTCFRDCTNFNGGIGDWDVSSVLSMNNMFRSASSFNQPIGDWDVSSVTSMSQMFLNSSFNQNLSAWNLRKAGVVLTEIFRSSGMSCANYTDTIVGWANYVTDNTPDEPINLSMTTQTGRVFANDRSGGANFADAGAARTFLTTATPTGAGWTISGDTVQASC